MYTFYPVSWATPGGGDILAFLCVWMAQVGGGDNIFFLCVCGPHWTGPFQILIRGDTLSKFRQKILNKSLSLKQSKRVQVRATNKGCWSLLQIPHIKHFLGQYEADTGPVLNLILNRKTITIIVAFILHPPPSLRTDLASLFFGFFKITDMMDLYLNDLNTLLPLPD